MIRFDSGWAKLQRRHPCRARALLALLAIPLLWPWTDARPDRFREAYDHAYGLFLHGYLEKSQQEAHRNAERFSPSDSDWAGKFRLLEAEAMLYRGMYADSLRLLAAYAPAIDDPEATVRKLATEASALIRLQQLPMAAQRLAQARDLCKNAEFDACGDVLRAFGNLSMQRGHFAEAREFFGRELRFAHVHQDRWLEASSSVSLGWAALQLDYYDEALEWSRLARDSAAKLGSANQEQVAAGNMGWAYYQLGDEERALSLFLEAEKNASEHGNIHSEARWLENIGYVSQASGDVTPAVQSYRKALQLARQIDSKEDILICLEDLALAAIDAGRLDEARAYLDEAEPLQRASGNSRDDPLSLARGRLAAARREERQAEAILRSLEDDPASHTTERLSAGLERARLCEREGRVRDAEAVYKGALAVFDEARAQLRSDESRLPFMAKAQAIYDGYIRLLIDQGRVEEALRLADGGRARTLAQGLGAETKPVVERANLFPGRIAQKTGATLLFYWLGEKRSYLWAIAAGRTALYPLPARAEIATRVERYRKAVLGVEDPLAAGSAAQSFQDGRALYDLLVAPASRLIVPQGKVAILADGPLSQLNFETLLAPNRPLPKKDVILSDWSAAQKTICHPERPERSAGSRRTCVCFSSRSATPRRAAATAGPSTPFAAKNATNFAQDDSAVRERVPDPAESGFHYWIEDATVLRAPSLSLLATAKPPRKARGRLLLMGDAVSPSADYPELALAGMEMKLVQKHFSAAGQTVFARDKATPSAYLAGKPEQFNYLHFVTHGTASTTAPLESAIVLSREAHPRDAGAEPAFKLYARDILQHPIDARLATVSACYGSGARTYAGEGLIGLAWAFLRAGAHNVIGALWEVSDDSTPRLMDSLYTGLDRGLEPASALRQAKLDLLHAPGRFHAPFFWAGFEIYAGR